MNTTTPDIDHRLRKSLASSMRTSADKLTPATRFVADLQVDSLDVVEALMAVEEEFEIEISDEDAEGLVTYHDAFSYVNRRLGEREGRTGDERPSGLLEDIPSSAMTTKQLAQALAVHLNQLQGEPEDLFNWHTVGQLVGRYSIAMVPEFDHGFVTAWRCQAFEAMNEPGTSVGRGYDKDQLTATVRALVDLHLSLGRRQTVH